MTRGVQNFDHDDQPSGGGSAEQPNRRRRWRYLTRASSILILVFVSGCGLAWWIMIRMPGESFQGELPELSDEAVALRNELLKHVHTLAADIGERNPAIESPAK